MKHVIEGNLYPILTVHLNKDEKILAQTEAFLCATKGIEMSTQVYGGIIKATRRLAGGDSVYLSSFLAREDDQMVSFSDNVCGNMVILDIDADHSYLCERASYLCSEPGVDLDVAFLKRIRVGLFGGEGLILERLSGEGKAVLHGWGELHKRVLKEGEELEVASSRILAVSTTINLDVKFVKSINNILFSGRGLFTTHLTGPGEAYIQSFFPPTKLGK